MPGRPKEGRKSQVYKRLMAGKVVKEEPKEVKKEDSKKVEGKKEKKEESDEEKE